MCKACDYTIHGRQHHFGWDNSLVPAERVAPGSTILFHCHDSSAGQLGPSSTLQDVIDLDFGKINPVSGPIYVEGAEPGDTLAIEIVDLHTRGWGWTAILPGLGLLADDFTEPYLRVFDLSLGDRFVFREDIIVPLIFSTISYFMIGFTPSVSRFFFYFAIGLLSHYASVLFAGLSSAISRNFATATLIANLAFTVYTFACGFFIQGNSIPIYLRWMKWISHLVRLSRTTLIVGLMFHLVLCVHCIGQ